MSRWPATTANRVLAALLRTGWSIKRQTGSHRILQRAGFSDCVFAFHDNDEIGPRMLARIANIPGLRRKTYRVAAKAYCADKAVSTSRTQYDVPNGMASSLKS